MTTEPRFLINHVCAALDQRLEQMPASTQERLARARMAALASRPQAALAPARVRVARPVPAGAGFASGALGGLWRSGLTAAFPLLIAAAGIAGLYQLEHRQHLQEVAELDAMVLTDDLPLSAYADRGFNVYLANRGS